jgi:hypothetical protein
MSCIPSIVRIYDVVVAFFSLTVFDIGIARQGGGVADGDGHSPGGGQLGGTPAQALPFLRYPAGPLPASQRQPAGRPTNLPPRS